MTAPGVVMIMMCKLQQFSFVVELLFKAAEGGEFTQAHCCNDSSQIGIKSNTFFFLLCACVSVSVCLHRFASFRHRVFSYSFSFPCTLVNIKNNYLRLCVPIQSEEPNCPFMERF